MLNTNTSLRRRGFLARLSAAAAALSASALLPRGASAQTVPPSHELDAWLDDLKGQHKQIYDCVTKTHINELSFATNFVTTNVNAYGLKDTDVNVIVSLRHEATPFGFNDAMWEKYKIGDALQIPQRTPGGRGAAADTMHVAPDSARARGDSTPVVMATRNPQANALRTLAGHGVYITVCSLATQRVAGEYARKANLSAADVRADLLANLVTNCRPVAAGVIIVNRAQERGFSYLFVG